MKMPVMKMLPWKALKFMFNDLKTYSFGGVIILLQWLLLVYLIRFFLLVDVEEINLLFCD